MQGKYILGEQKQLQREAQHKLYPLLAAPELFMYGYFSNLEQPQRNPCLLHAGGCHTELGLTSHAQQSKLQGWGLVTFNISTIQFTSMENSIGKERVPLRMECKPLQYVPICFSDMPKTGGPNSIRQKSLIGNTGASPQKTA